MDLYHEAVCFFCSHVFRCHVLTVLDYGATIHDPSLHHVRLVDGRVGTYPRFVCYRTCITQYNLHRQLFVRDFHRWFHMDKKPIPVCGGCYLMRFTTRVSIYPVHRMYGVFYSPLTTDQPMNIHHLDFDALLRPVIERGRLLQTTAGLLYSRLPWELIEAIFAWI